MKLRKLMKAALIAETIIKAEQEAVKIAITGQDITGSIARHHYVKTQHLINAIAATPARVFRKDRPRVDKRRLKRALRSARINREALDAAGAGAPVMLQ